MKAKHTVVIAEPVRTAIGTLGGAPKDVAATQLGSIAIKGAVVRPTCGLTRSRPSAFPKKLDQSRSNDVRNPQRR
jgi:acetyl-CoA acetyltransferase